MEQRGIFDNAAMLNQYMTNERISFQLDGLKMNVLWVSFPPSTGTGRKKGNAHQRIHSHTFCETHLCVCGYVCYEMADGRRFTIHEGDTIFIGENVEHELVEESNGACKISMAYRLEDNKTVFNRAADAQQVDVFILQQADGILKCYEHISEELENRRIGYREIVEVQLFQIAMTYERHISVVDGASLLIQRIDKRVDEINEFILSNMSKPITTADVAEHLHLSKRQINRIVMKEFGVSCTGLILDIKHKRAQELLIYSDESIANIAAMLGYGNIFSFGRFFKRKEGMSPALFRNSHYSY